MNAQLILAVHEHMNKHWYDVRFMLKLWVLGDVLGLDSLAHL